VPPPNAIRRAALLDAAIQVLARGGTKGLTHRAVDLEAGEPPGTTSRYFRTREALLSAVVTHATAIQLHQLDTAASGPAAAPTVEQVVEILTGAVQAAVSTDQARHLAMAELFLEGTRCPGLQPRLTSTMTAMLPSLRKLLSAANLRDDRDQVVSLVALLNGLVFTMMTTPLSAFGVTNPGPLIRHAIRALIEPADSSSNE